MNNYKHFCFNMIGQLAIFCLVFLGFLVFAQNAHAAEFNGTVTPQESGVRFSPPDVSVSCVSNCGGLRWAGDNRAHFNVTGTNHEIVSIRLNSPLPTPYSGCTWRVDDRGSDPVDNPQLSIHASGEGCTATFEMANTQDWRYGVHFQMTTPPPPPPPDCGDPEWLSVTATCNNDEAETGRFYWSWADYNFVDLYLIEFSQNPNFSSVEYSRTSAFNTYLLAVLAEPDIPRYHRVRVESWGSDSSCSGTSSGWSPVVEYHRNCASAPDPGDPGEVGQLDTIFCDTSGNPTNDPASGELYTAIGCIPINDLDRFTSFILNWSIGIAGGIILILFAYAAVLYIISKGDPRKLQAAKELILAALTGMLLLLFSAFLFQLIGVEILRIPGL